jgi:linoleoyl-CoA desaturase
MAHCVDEAEFPSADTPRRGEDFVAFQMRTTVDIRSSAPIVGPLFRWLVGGLDYQVEHHLAPRLPHTVYAQTAAQFRTLCDRAGVVAVRRHTSVMAALRSHTRWLVAMGRRPVVATT